MSLVMLSLLHETCFSITFASNSLNNLKHSFTTPAVSTFLCSYCTMPDLPSISSSQSCCLQLVPLWLVSAPHLKGGVQTSTQFSKETSPVPSRAQGLLCFPTGSRKPGLGADIAVLLPVPELSHSFGYLWLFPCCKVGEIPSVLLNFSYWSWWVWEQSYPNLMTNVLIGT